MNENTLEKFEKLFEKHKSAFEIKIRKFFESSFEMLKDESTSEETEKKLIDEFNNKTFKYGVLNYISLVQALTHLAKGETSHNFKNSKICEICGIHMNDQYKYKKFNTWHFDDGGRIHRIK